ncbi:methyl-accepting chemotaxis protein, partial [Kineosporia rhizophila]
MSRLSAWPIRIVFRVLVAITVLALAAIVVAVTVSHRSQTDSRDQYEQTIVAYVNVKDMENTGTKIVLDNTIITYVPQASEQYRSVLDTDIAKMKELVASSAGLDIPDDLKQQIAAVGTAYTDLGDFLVGLAPPKNAAETAQQGEDFTAKSTAANEAIAAALETAYARVQKLDADIDDAGRSSNITTLTLCVVTALLIGGLLLAYGRRIAGGIEALKTAVEQISAGDLTHPVPAHGKDELAQMAGALENMRLKLAQIFRQLVDSSNRLGDSATTLSGIFTEVGATSDRSSAQMGSVSATANEVSANIQTVAAGSEEMGASIGEIARSAGDAAREATAAVSAVESTTSTMNKLGESSREIGDV